MIFSITTGWCEKLIQHYRFKARSRKNWDKTSFKEYLPVAHRKWKCHGVIVDRLEWYLLICLSRDNPCKWVTDRKRRVSLAIVFILRPSIQRTPNHRGELNKTTIFFSPHAHDTAIALVIIAPTCQIMGPKWWKKGPSLLPSICCLLGSCLFPSTLVASSRILVWIGPRQSLASLVT